MLQNGCNWRDSTSCPVPKTASCLYASSKSGSKSSKLETRDGERFRNESTSSRSLATQYAHTSPTLSLRWPGHATVIQGISSRMAQIAHFFGMCSSLVLKDDGVMCQHFSGHKISLVFRPTVCLSNDSSMARHINSFQRTSRVARLLQGGEKMQAVWASHHEEF